MSDGKENQRKPGNGAFLQALAHTYFHPAENHLSTVHRSAKFRALSVCVCVRVCVCDENVARAARVNFINVWRWPFLILSRTRSTKRPFVNDLSRNCAGCRAPFVPNFFEKIRPAAGGWKKTCN